MLADPIYHDEVAARAYFEAIRWPTGPVCPHCRIANEATKLEGEAHRPGVYKCRPCGSQFSVTVGSVMESSHIPLHKWALAFHLMAGAKKGVPAKKLMRELGLGSYRTAWLLARRVRQSMSSYGFHSPYGSGKTADVDDNDTDETRFNLR